jgi:protein subunit release factor A
MGDPLNLSDFILIGGFLVSIGATKMMLTERSSRNKEDIEDHERRITALENNKADKADVRELTKSLERIFDKIDTKQSIEDAKTWREMTCESLNEIKAAIKDVNQKIDQYLLTKGKE